MPHTRLKRVAKKKFPLDKDRQDAFVASKKKKNDVLKKRTKLRRNEEE